MALSAYEEFANEPLVFPIGGKNYVCKPVSIPAGRKLAALVNGRDKEFAKAPTEELWRLVLGDLWDQFVEDGVADHAMIRAGLTALADWQYDRETAEAAWEAGADPKALQAYVETKRAQTGNRAQRRSKSTAVARKTP